MSVEYREFTNLLGERVRVRVEIHRDNRFEHAILQLASKAKASKSKKASALGGAVQVVIESVESCESESKK